MNMMSLQERQEEQAVPEFVRDLRTEFAQEDSLASLTAAPAPVAPPQESRATLLERLAWFRNLSLARKINTIFGTFFAAGLLMVLVLGLGLTELWNRYNVAAQAQETLLVASQLQSDAGELRYHSVRVLYDRSTTLREEQRSGAAALANGITAVDAAIGKESIEITARIADVREELARFETTFERASDAVRAGGNANAAAADVSRQGSAL